MHVKARLVPALIHSEALAHIQHLAIVHVCFTTLSISCLNTAKNSVILALILPAPRFLILKRLFDLLLALDLGWLSDFIQLLIQLVAKLGESLRIAHMILWRTLCGSLLIAGVASCT